jgi:hypothetical protein
MTREERICFPRQIVPPCQKYHIRSGNFGDTKLNQFLNAVSFFSSNEDEHSTQGFAHASQVLYLPFEPCLQSQDLFLNGKNLWI